MVRLIILCLREGLEREEGGLAEIISVMTFDAQIAFWALTEIFCLNADEYWYLSRSLIKGGSMNYEQLWNSLIL